MDCNQQSFTITSAAFEKLKQQAEAAGLEIDNEIGQANYRGCTIAWDYNQTTGELTMQCLDKPFFVPCSYVYGKIHGWVQAAMVP